MSRIGLLSVGVGLVVIVALVYLAFAPESGPRGPSEPDVPDVGSGPGVGPDEAGNAGVVPVEPPTAGEAVDMVQMVLSFLKGEGPPLPDSTLDRIRNTEEGIEAVLEILAGDYDDDMRASALFALGGSRLDSGKEVVERGVRGEFGPELRTAAILSLASAEPDRALPMLENVFLSEPDEGVCLAALQTIGSHWDRQAAIEAWADLLERTPDGSRKAYLYLGLGNMIPPVETEEPESITRLRGTFRGLPPGPFEPAPEERRYFERMLDRALAETDEQYTAPATVFVARLQGARAREGLRQIWDRASAKEREFIVELLDPRISGADKLPDFVRLAPGLEDKHLRERISSQLENWPDPDLIGDIEDWANRETDDGIRKELNKTISRLRGE